MFIVLKATASDSKSLANSSSASFNSSSDNDTCIQSSKRHHSDSQHQEVSDDIEDLDARVVHHNQPVLISVYKDPETLADKVCVVVTLPSGVTDVTFGLVGTGPATSSAKISYRWPTVMFNVEGLFESHLKEKMSPTHPIILSLKSELENNRKKIDETPRGTMQISLPIPVQTNHDKFTFKAGKNSEGVLVVSAQLSAFDTAYTAKQSDFPCKFQNF